METVRYNNGCKPARTEGYTGPCLECPFDKCFEDADFDWGVYRQGKRESEIKDLWDNGVSIHKLMKQFHISSKTVYGICSNG